MIFFYHCTLLQGQLAAFTVSVIGYYQRFSTLQMIVLTVVIFNFAFPMSAVLAHVHISEMTAQLFSQLKDEIETKANISNLVTDLGEMEFLLTKWRQRYVQLIELVDCISRCFGLVLLETMVFLFLDFTNGLFFASVLLKHNFHIMSIVSHVTNRLLYTAYLLILTYLPSKLKREV